MGHTLKERQDSIPHEISASTDYPAHQEYDNCLKKTVTTDKYSRKDGLIFLTEMVENGLILISLVFL